jgi:hypothetical protein
MYGLGDPTVVPTDYVAPPTGPQAPAGYWVNPANSTQWLSQTDAAKLGGFCFQAPTIGQWAVGGNYTASALYCGNLTCQQNLMIYGGIGAALFLFLSGGSKWLGLVPAAWGALQCIGAGFEL